MSEEKKVVPDQEKGIATDTESSVVFKDESEAIAHFQVVRERLLNVSRWREISKVGPSDFQVTDAEGNEIDRPVQKGDYFKIDIPGPGSASGEGADWVHIKEIAEEKDSSNKREMTAIKVRPASNPQNRDNNTSHFFDEQASSTFLVKREDCTITASVHGRNENPNTETENFTDKIRNAVVAVGAMLGFSKAQWKSLVEGLVEK